MKVCWLFVVLALASVCQASVAASRTVRPYCLEELKEKWSQHSSIERRYKDTGEHNCFALKTHVARCLDKSLLQLVRTLHPDDKERPPSLELETLEETLDHYFKSDRLPSIKAKLEKCSHTNDGGKRVIAVGDFSKRCACDFGSDRKCLAYEHMRSVFNCGPVEDLVPSDTL